MKSATLSATMVAAIVAAPPLLADEGHGDGPAIGQPASAAAVDRTIHVRLLDSMAYDPSEITVAPGETVRFALENAGSIVHEFNIGTPETWDSHKAEMQRMMDEGMMTVDEVRHDRMRAAGMMHDDPGSVLLEPGDTAEVIWTFPDGGALGFACNVPGHREAGMRGDVIIR